MTFTPPEGMTPSLVIDDTENVCPLGDDTTPHGHWHTFDHMPADAPHRGARVDENTPHWHAYRRDLTDPRVNADYHLFEPEQLREMAQAPEVSAAEREHLEEVAALVEAMPDPPEDGDATPADWAPQDSPLIASRDWQPTGGTVTAQVVPGTAQDATPQDAPTEETQP